MSKIKSIAFSNSKGLPKPTEELDKRQGFVKWGDKNDYPFYLIDMYNGSAWHQGIMRTKAYYVAGGGIKVVSGVLEQFLENQFSDYSIDEVMRSCAFDFEMFDAFALLGTWDKEGNKVARWEHIDVDSIRMNEDESIYFLSDDWNARKQTPEDTNFREIRPLDKSNKVGQFIIYYKTPVKKAKGEKGIYPKPSYNGGLTSINTDYLISKYHLHEIQNGFKGGTIVNLANGQPETEEEARAHRDAIKGTTTNIEDTNQLIITFSDGQENAPTVLPLNGNDLADRYNMTEKSVQQNILVAHSATNPLLFGIKTEGQLGGATELLESYEIFKSLYVNSRQKQLEYILNWMIELSGYQGSVEFEDAKPISMPEQPQQMKEEFSNCDNDLKIFSEYGLNKGMFETVKSVSIPNDFSSNEVAEMETKILTFDKIGDIKAGLTELDKNILTLLESGEDGASIAKALDAPLLDVAKSIQRLTELKLINKDGVSSLGGDILKGVDSSIDEYEVRYSYEVKPGLGSAKIPTTRPFCETLIDLDRMYLRSEIETISNRIGRDVWRYRGGFYNNGERTTPWCRHEWVQHLVKKK